MAHAAITTVGELLDAWCAHIARLGRSPSTLASYRYKIDAVLRPHLGSTALTELSALRIDLFYGDLLDEGMSAASVNHHHRILRAALSQAVRWGLLVANPARLASPPRSKPPALTPPSSEQVAAMIVAADADITPVLGPLIRVASTTGLRRGELSALRWSDIHLADGSLHVTRSIWQVSANWGIKDPKTHQSRRVMLGAATTEVLTELQTRRVEAVDDTDAARQGFVFSRSLCGDVPFLPESVTRSFRRLLRQLEASTSSPWPFRFHDLRHYMATQLIAAGHNPRTVADRLGHADVAVTLRTYTHDTEEQARRAADEIDQTLRSFDL